MFQNTKNTITKRFSPKNYRNLPILLHFFGKNYVKTTFLHKEMPFLTWNLKNVNIKMQKVILSKNWGKIVRRPWSQSLNFG